MDLKEQKWIPYQRHLFVLKIDKKQTFSARFMMRKSAVLLAERLSLFRGYDPTVYDTKRQMIYFEDGRNCEVEI